MQVAQPKVGVQCQKRYTIWRIHPLHNLVVLPIFFGSEESALKHETNVIRQLQPPWQDPPASEARSKKIRQPRKWPSQRPNKSEREHCKLNVHTMVEKI